MFLCANIPILGRQKKTGAGTVCGHRGGGGGPPDLDVSPPDAPANASSSRRRARPRFRRRARPRFRRRAAPAPAPSPAALPPAALPHPVQLPTVPLPAACKCAAVAQEFAQHAADLELCKKVLAKHSEYFEKISQTMVTNDKIDTLFTNFKSFTEGLARGGLNAGLQAQYMQQEQHFMRPRTNFMQTLPFTM